MCFEFIGSSQFAGSVRNLPILEIRPLIRQI